jgi:hypothetical protein
MVNLVISKSENERLHMINRVDLCIEDFIASYEPKADPLIRLPKPNDLVTTFRYFPEIRIMNVTDNSFELVRNVPKPGMFDRELKEKISRLPFKDGSLVARVEYIHTNEQLPIVKVTFFSDGYNRNFDEFGSLYLGTLEKEDDWKIIPFQYLCYKVEDTTTNQISIYSTNNAVSPARNDYAFLEHHFPRVLDIYLHGDFKHNWNAIDKTQLELTTLREQASRSS